MDIEYELRRLNRIASNKNKLAALDLSEAVIALPVKFNKPKQTRQRKDYSSLPPRTKQYQRYANLDKNYKESPVAKCFIEDSSHGFSIDESESSDDNDMEPVCS